MTRGNRNFAYDLTGSDMVRAGAIDRLPAEKQAVFVESCFMDARLVFPGSPEPKRLRDHAVAQSMMHEVQSARPLLLGQIIEEAAFGPQPSLGAFTGGGTAGTHRTSGRGRRISRGMSSKRQLWHPGRSTLGLAPSPAIVAAVAASCRTSTACEAVRVLELAWNAEGWRVLSFEPEPP